MPTCPWCAEEIQAAAVICKSCSRPVALDRGSECALLNLKSPRPLSITLVSWFLIIGALLNTYWTLSSLHTPESQMVLASHPLSPAGGLLFLLAGMAPSFVSGIAMLARRDWGRWLWMISMCAQVLVGLLTAVPMWSHAVSLFVVAPIVFVLLRPAANAYFMAGQPEDAGPWELVIRPAGTMNREGR